MFRNYFFIAWRNLTRNKLHTTINLGGLIIGFTIGIAVLAVVYSQLTFNGFNVNRAKIYQAYDFSNNVEGEQINSLFGLAAGPRRRTPGLRREELAQLAGVSTTWYTWIEQGRDVGMSPGALMRPAA